MKSILSLSLIALTSLCIILSFLNVTIPLIIIYLTIGLLVFNFTSFILKKNVFLYTCKRIVGMVFLMFIISTITFILLRTLPGGPFDQEVALPAEVMKNIEKKYNLDGDIHEQYFLYLKGLVRGDLGVSYKYLEQDVTDILKQSLPNSVQLGLYSLILSLLIGIPLGVFSATKHNTFWDRVAMILAISGISLPNFLVAPVLILIFCFYVNWFPVALWEGPSYYVLPVIVLGTRPISIIARLTRASVLDVLGSDYVRTARAKGLHPTKVLYKHVLKNSFIPVLTFLGPITAFLLTGSFIIEHIFAIPGMSKHLVTSIINRDYPLVLGATLVYCFIIILANLVVDILYSYFDPRMKPS